MSDPVTFLKLLLLIPASVLVVAALAHIIAVSIDKDYE